MAGSDNFTGQNIQDTYQRVLQISSSGQLADGTGSLVPLLEVTASFALSASVEITHEVSSSHAQTADTADIANALATGDQTITGDLTIPGKIIHQGDTDTFTDFGTNQFLVNTGGTNKLSIGSSWIDLNNEYQDVNFKVFGSGSVDNVILWGDGGKRQLGIGTNNPDQKLTVNGNIHVSGSGHITASGDISSSGDIISSRLILDNPIADGAQFDMTGAGVMAIKAGDGSALNQIFTKTAEVTIGTSNTKGASLTVAKNLFTGTTAGTGHITASGDISSSSEIHAASYNIENRNLANLPATNKIRFAYDTQVDFIEYGKGTDASHFFYGSAITASGDISSSGHVIANRVYPGGPDAQFITTANGQIQSSTGFSGTNITASGEISASTVITTDLKGTGDTTGLEVGGYISASGADGVISGMILSASDDLYIGDDADIKGDLTVAGTVSATSTATSSFKHVKVDNNLDVAGDTKLAGETFLQDDMTVANGWNLRDNNGNSILYLSGNAGLYILGRTIRTNDTNGIKFGADSDYRIMHANSPERLLFQYGASTKLTMSASIFGFSSDSKVGIGTTTAGTELEVVGDVSASGTIVGSNLSGTNTGDQNISNLAITGSDVTFANISASNDITASGTVYGAGLNINGPTITFNDNDIDDVGSIGVDYVIADTNGDNKISFESDKIDTRLEDSSVIEATETRVRILRESSGNGSLEMTGNISASGDITASGNIHASQIHLPHGGDIIWDGDTNTRIETSGNPEDLDIYADRHIRLKADGNVDFGDGPKIRFDTDNDLFNTNVTSEISILTTNISASGDITASGNVYGDTIYGNNLEIATTATFNGNISVATTASLNYVTASKIDVDGDTIRIGGESMNKTLLQNLKDGFDSDSRSGGGAKFKGHITASGDISASGDFIGTNIGDISDEFIPVTPADFTFSDDSSRAHSGFTPPMGSTGAGGGALTVPNTANNFAIKIIPQSMVAYAAQMNGSDSSNVISYHQSDITKADTGSLGANTTMNTTFTFATPVEGDGITYVIVKWHGDARTDLIYGGKIFIRPV